MFDLSALKAAKQKVKVRDDTRLENSDKAYNEALDLLQKFNSSTNHDKIYLQEAADKLIEALENKRNKPEPYICLSCIFYFLDNHKLAVKYLKIADSLKPDLPQIKQLKALISDVSFSKTEMTDKENEVPSGETTNVNVIEKPIEEKSTQKIGSTIVNKKPSILNNVKGLKKLF